MSACPRIRPRRGESGQALVLALAILFVGTLLGLGAVAFALSAGQQSSHDQHRRGAQQASDAGVEQQLYQQADSNAVGFDLPSGSLGALLDCVESHLGVSADVSAQTGLARASVADSGVCPQQTCTAGAPNCSTDGGPLWSSLDNGDYYDAEFCPNVEYQSSSATATAACSAPSTSTTSSSLGVEFPEILSVGCHSPAATCDTGASTNQYAKQLVLLSPTAPLQAVEGENNVEINPTGENTCTGLNLLGVLCVGPSTAAATVVDGNIVAGDALALPASSLGLNTGDAGNLVTDALNYLTGVLGLTSLTSPVTTDLGLSGNPQPVSLTPTFEYGKCDGTTVSSDSSGAYTCSGTPTAINGNLVQTGLHNDCVAGKLSPQCTLVRPSFSIGDNAPLTPSATISNDLSGGTLGDCSTGDCYDNGDLSLTSGTLKLGPGTYVFCNVDIGSGATLEGPTGTSTGAVQIYVLSPGSSQCSANGSGPNEVQGTACTGSDSEGNFVAAGGISNGVPGLVDGISSTVDPSNFQVYVAGDTGDSLTVDKNCQPRTQVSIGASGLNVSQAFIVYAPRSNVSVTTNLIFEGAVVGWNVQLTALAILQDLDLGNYPLSAVVNSYQPAQTISCAPSSTELTQTSADLSGC